LKMHPMRHRPDRDDALLGRIDFQSSNQSRIFVITALHKPTET